MNTHLVCQASDHIKIGRGFKVGRYFYPSEIVYSTGRNYWTPQN
jgi:hypothetical protein